MASARSVVVTHFGILALVSSPKFGGVRYSEQGSRINVLLVLKQL